MKRIICDFCGEDIHYADDSSVYTNCFSTTNNLWVHFPREVSTSEIGIKKDCCFSCQYRMLGDLIAIQKPN